MKTDQLFETLRQAPVDIPIGKIEQIVTAGTVAGTAAAAVKASLLKKLVLKFHLNSIVAMTSITATATLATVIAVSSFAGKEHKTASHFNKTENTKTFFSPQQNSLEQNQVLELFSNDTPQTKINPNGTNSNSTFVFYTSGDSVTTKTVSDSTGTKVIVTSNAADMHMVHVSDYAENDSAAYDYNYAYALANLKAAEAALDFNRAGLRRQVAVAEKDARRAEKDAAQAEKDAAEAARNCCALASLNALNCRQDSLFKVIEDELIKDGLIDDRKEYSFDFNGKSMKVNGKRQDHYRWEKYKALIENNSDNKVNRKFQYMIMVNRGNTRIMVDNDN